MQGTKRKAASEGDASHTKTKKVKPGKTVAKDAPNYKNKSKSLTNLKSNDDKDITKNDEFRGKSFSPKDKKFKSSNMKTGNKKSGTVNQFSKTTNGEEKPKWSEMKKEKKQLRIVRRKAKATAEVFEVAHRAKLLSAQILRKVVKPEFRESSCKELHGLLKGQYKSIALTHDLSRVIQVLLKHAPEDIKIEISTELLDVMVQMAQSKYAQHSIKRILKYGNDIIRHEVIKKFFGSIVSLATHSISAPVLDIAYGEYATKKDKIYMKQEFFGEMYRNAKDGKVESLADAYKGTPEMKAAILQTCKANIQKVLDKNLHDGELFHSVLYDYMCECDTEERTELVSTLSPLIVPLSNSLPGVMAACICVWQGTNKDKKTILKVVKEHALPLSKHKTGHRLLLAIFDTVDDTVLVRKAIVSTLASNLKEVAKDHWGLITLHWLVKPRDPQAFHPNLTRQMAEGARAGNSKKYAETRVTELREGLLPLLMDNISSDPEFWLSSKATMLLLTAIMSVESSKEVFDALARVMCSPEWRIQVAGQDMLAVEEAGIHMCLKKLALLDKCRETCTLGQAVCEHLGEEALQVWLTTNRGCFFLLKLIENNKENVANKLKKKVLPLRFILNQSFTQGAKLLTECLNK